ncbi:hypothetical protein ACETK8_07750 [Brevundimonas staleyi]|uniref:Uncharacterized protein n=1 Tax=Brevundimonas staleyi TaxID=74326 RepID=A0ABW0FNY6_9CAUL
MRVSLILFGAALGLMTAAPASAAPDDCVWTSRLTNPRLPLGRLRDLPSGMVCPAALAAPAPGAPVAEPVATPVTVVVLHEIRVRPSQVIIEPPEIHFVDELPPAEAPPAAEPTP